MYKKTNIFLIIQSLIINYFIWIMVHPSMILGRFIGSILSFVVFYASWKLFPLITKRQINTNKFSLLFLILLFFPHHLLRNYHFILLGFIIYYLVVYLFVKHTKLSENLIVLFLIISISFSALHIVMNDEYKETALEKSLARKVEGPVRYRILIPELMNLSRALTGLEDLLGLMVIFRFISLALVFLSTHILVMLFSSNQALSIFLPLMYIFMIPFSWDVLYVTDFPEILLSTLFIYSMFRNSYAWASVFFILGALNKDTIIFNLAFFGFYTILRVKKPIKNLFKTIKTNKKIFLFLISLFLILLILKFSIISIYGKTWYYEDQLKENLYHIKEYISRFERFNFQGYENGFHRFFSFLIFSGGIYLLVVLFYRKIPYDFLVSFVLTFLLFVPLFLYIGTLNETRILYVFYPYTIICLTYIFKDNFRLFGRFK